MEGLPEEMSSRYWEIDPANPDPRNPDFEHFVSTLDVVIRHSVVKAAEGERASYLPDARTIRLPPFELFFSAADYYLTLAHELIHWADDSTGLAGVGPVRATAVRGWRELVAEFGAVFVCDEMGVAGNPRGSPLTYVALWRDEGRLSDTEVHDAAETAADLTTWLYRLAPGWRVSDGERGWRPQQGDRRSCITRDPADIAPGEQCAALVADVRARAFVMRAEALGKMDPEADPDAWEREASRLLEMAGQIDLTIPADEAAFEAAVAHETPAAATRVTAATWLRDFQERTAHIRATQQTTRSAGTRSENDSPTRSNHVRSMPSFLSGRGPRSPGRCSSAATDEKAEAPPIRGHGCFRAGWVFLVESVDTTQPDDDAVMGIMRLQEQLTDIDVGTVLFHCPVDPVIPPAERPWQAGRVHLDGIRWEEKTWPRKAFPAFRDHVASLMEFTVPGDERPQSRNLPVLSDASSVGSDTP
ncbi:MAG: zincin-like metallopeptidase domain-containing protein [bacterium]|nr:zincin-like metallopeptidase domain-containing protein [bacterium]MDE0239726.1 zincin-like metallopeptidase domain-containing protein [bacterium]MDE0416653.1 zincin-like metallopeptidase domain-containing protein [bacterium]